MQYIRIGNEILTPEQLTHRLNQQIKYLVEDHRENLFVSREEKQNFRFMYRWFYWFYSLERYSVNEY